MASPADRRYLESHEWHKTEGDLVVIGISQFAVDELTDVTYVDIRVASGAIARGDAFGEVESVKATSEVYSGVTGEVVEANQAVIEDPSLINSDPFGKGWLIKVRPTDLSQLDSLLDAAAYDRKSGG